MGIDTGMYEFMKFLHVLAAIVGLGGIFLTPVYAMRAKRHQGAEGLAISEANEAAIKVADYFLYAIPILGFALVGMSDGVWELTQVWLWLSIALYVVALGLALGILAPTARRMQQLMRELIAAAPAPGGPPPQAVELEALGKKAGAVGGVTHLIGVALIFLMVVKPGL